MKKTYTAPRMKAIEMEVEALTTPSSDNTADVRSSRYGSWEEKDND